MVNCVVMGLASRLPRADRTPAGIVTVTRVDGLNGTAGVNISVSPVACQLPGTLGLMAGRGDPADTGAEKVTWTGSLPSACRAPGAGVIEITRNGPGRVTPGLIGALGGADQAGSSARADRGGPTGKPSPTSNGSRAQHRYVIGPSRKQAEGWVGEDGAWVEGPWGR